MQNIVAGFRTTGVFPFNGYVLQPSVSTPPRFNPISLPERKFIPLYSPARQGDSPARHDVPIFSDDELSLFQRRAMTCHLMIVTASGYKSIVLILLSDPVLKL